MSKLQLNPDQLKTQLEQKILEDHQENLRIKNETENINQKQEAESQKTENKYQKFGIKVFPEEKSPKSAELSQNDNNINLERHPENNQSTDETDRPKAPPEVKRREKPIKNVVNDSETFIRQNSLNDSGIKRDKNGIPQEIPNHMLNAAVAARKNRKTEEKEVDVKSPKKIKGKAPAPPPELKTNDVHDLDQIETANEETVTNQNAPSPVETEIVTAKEEDDLNEINNKNYNSDSDGEVDNHSSVNTIELNASDITIHQTEENEETKQNRKTASTGDLTKIHKTRKTSSGTLERAQSLDITDTGMPQLNKKRKATNIEFDSKTSSDDSLYGKVLMNKEPRLSLILDGLNTFQRSRLKKSTEWGNLEDAILNINKDEGSNESINNSLSTEVTKESPEFDALVNKINEIKNETEINIEIPSEENVQIITAKILSDYEKAQNVDGTEIWPTFENSENKVNGNNYITSIEDELINDDEINQEDVLALEEQIRRAEINLRLNETENKSDDYVPNNPKTNHLNSLDLTKDFILAEKSACDNDASYIIKNDDTNISDDIKVSRHSLDRLKPETRNNVSNITITEKKPEDDFNTYNVELNLKKPSSLPKPVMNVTKIETTKTKMKNPIKPETNLNKEYDNYEYSKIVTTPDLIKNVTIAEAIHNLNNEVTIEGPSSLTLEINENYTAKTNNCVNGTRNENKIEIDLNKNKTPNLSKSVSNLTYITEIQVLTPNKTAKSNPNISEIEIVPSEENNKNIRNLDTEFEKYVKNFETNIRTFETNIKNYDTTVDPIKNSRTEKIIDPEKELHKIHEIAEEQLKKLPEMRFTTSSYESNKPQEKRHSHIEQLRSNFEKSNDKNPSKTLKMDIGVTKSRIPIAASIKTPPTSPERRDSRNLDIENQKEILEMMSSPSVTSTFKYQPKTNNKNVTVTSIRTNSKIPSGLPTYINRPPIPPKKPENVEVESIVQVSTNGGNENSFKQWVFNPNDNAITNITVSENKNETKP